jgi:hypothetical protein
LVLWSTMLISKVCVLFAILDGGWKWVCDAKGYWKCISGVTMGVGRGRYVFITIFSYTRPTRCAVGGSVPPYVCWVCVFCRSCVLFPPSRLATHCNKALE